MKEIALIGVNGHVFSGVLSTLLSKGYSVNALVTAPERVMLDNQALTVSRLDYADKSAMTEALRGYADVVITVEDNLQDHDHNDFVLRYYNEMVNAARDAGVSRVIVVGAADSSAFLMSSLRHHDKEIDWVFISTEGDYADHAACEVASPRFHREAYAA